MLHGVTQKQKAAAERRKQMLIGAEHECCGAAQNVLAPPEPRSESFRDWRLEFSFAEELARAK